MRPGVARLPYAGYNLVATLVPSGVAGLLWTAVPPTAAFAYPTAWMVLALLGLLAAHRG